MALSWRRACAALSVFAVLLTACATARSDAQDAAPLEDQNWQPSLANVYARMAAAMTRPGEVYQPTISIVESQGALAFSTRVRASIDIVSSRARGEVEAVFPPDIVKRTTWIIVGRRYHQTLEYDPTYMREATTCRGAEDPLVSVLIVCRGEGEDGVTTTLADADYHGTPSIALVTLGGVSSPGVRSTFTDTLFLDPETYLPIAQEGSGRIDTLDGAGNVVASEPSGRMVLYEHAFRPEDSYAAYHFDPAAIGFREPDVAATITKPRPDMSLYWLGANAAIDNLPPIAVRDAFFAEGAGRPAQRYRAIISYRPVANEFGPTLLEVQQWRPDEWQAAYREGFRAWPPDVCVLKEDLTVDGMSVVLYHGFSDGRRGPTPGVCPSVAPDRYVALVTTPFAVLRLSAPTDGIFNTREDMLAAVRALKPAY